MSLGPAVLPLTTRGHHLPSSRTQFYRFHSPFTHYYILSYSPLLQTKYSHSAWLINFSSLLLVDASTVVAVIVSHSCSCLEDSFWCFLDFVCLPFCLLNLVSPAFGPRPFFSMVLSYCVMTIVLPIDIAIFPDLWLLYGSHLSNWYTIIYPNAWLPQ